jgi:hypothetical protein
MIAGLWTSNKVAMVGVGQKIGLSEIWSKE